MNMNIKKLFGLIFFIIIVLLATIVIVSRMILETQRAGYKEQLQRVQGWALASEMRTSSDNLTQYSRAFVTTGDSLWINRYFLVLDQRNGKIPDAHGRKIRFIDSASRLNLPEVEFSLLVEAERRSNDLAIIEIAAMNAFVGLYPDNTLKYVVKGKPDPSYAKELLFNNKYLNDKNFVIKPINDFLALLKKRSMARVDYYNKKISYYITIVFTLTILVGLFSLISYLVLRRRLIKKMDECNNNNIKLIEAEGVLKRQNEELDKLNASKDKFFSIIAHDLRGPVGILMNFAELLDEKIREKDYTDIEFFTKNLSQSSISVNELLNNLLNWARAQNPNIKANTSEFDPIPVIRKNIELCAMLAREKDIEITLENTDNLLVIADPDQISLVFRNILWNAIKFTPKNGKISINVTGMNAGGKYIAKISFTDTGVGMNQTQVEKLFRIDSISTTRGTEGEHGTGLGLILCKDYIELNQGKITVDSRLNVGTTFTVYLPSKTVA
ncbi:MAG: HAMP domain-containing sensor histidine kinase [Rikenellaceae bacterium]|nr:HAMP domain-containing sensor histidine kinase [Rikenellaceae bacterium]